MSGVECAKRILTYVLSNSETLLYPFQAVASVEDDRRQENVEEHFRVKGHLSDIQKTGSCYSSGGVN